MLAHFQEALDDWLVVVTGGILRRGGVVVNS